MRFHGQTAAFHAVATLFASKPQHPLQRLRSGVGHADSSLPSLLGVVVARRMGDEDIRKLSDGSEIANAHPMRFFSSPLDTKRSTQSRKKCRPGRNSYLKVDFSSEHFIPMLHDTAMELANRVQQQQTQSCELSFHIAPRSMPKLHCTFFFGGETLSSLSAIDLQTWYNTIGECLHQTGFRTKRTKEISLSTLSEADSEPYQLSGTSGVKSDDSYLLRFKSFRLFPPERRNLIVAELEVSEAWQSLYQRICEVSSDDRAPADLVSHVRATSFGRWAPHVTLADVVWQKSGRTAATSDGQWERNQPLPLKRDQNRKVHPGSRSTGEDRHRIQQQERLHSLLEEMTAKFRERADAELCSTPQSISMGGPTPSQVTLDWDFIWSARAEDNVALASLPALPV
jgi:hypothetical protein